MGGASQTRVWASAALSSSTAAGVLVGGSVDSDGTRYRIRAEGTSGPVFGTFTYTARYKCGEDDDD